MDFDLDLLFLLVEPIASLGDFSILKEIAHGFHVLIETTATIESADV